MGHPWDAAWNVVKPLGGGGQGVTRLVESTTEPKRQGVLKYLKNNRSSSARARMRREVANLQALAALGARVPNVLDHNTDAYADPDIELYLIMSYVEGDTLKAFVEGRERLPVDQAVEFTLSLCDIVKIAHTEGVLHRDIKPDNIVVNQPSSTGLFIVDYGLSFNADDEDLTETLETFRNKFLDLPETNTPGGDRRDPRSDVTALCAVFYYLLTGHLAGQLQDASGKLPHLRPGFTIRELVADARQTQIELILSRGLSPALQSRFQNIDEFASRLATLAEQSSEAATPDPLTTAAELSVRLREQDRKTQLMEFLPPAMKLLTQMTDSVNSVGKQLGRFKITMHQGGSTGPAPDGNLDSVSGPFSLNLMVDHHGLKRQRTYCVASRGEQCVVVACDFRPDGRNMKAGAWRELAWYEGTPNKDVLTVLDNEFKQWVDSQLQEVVAELLST